MLGFIYSTPAKPRTRWAQPGNRNSTVVSRAGEERQNHRERFRGVNGVSVMMPLLRSSEQSDSNETWKPQTALMGVKQEHAWSTRICYTSYSVSSRSAAILSYNLYVVYKIIKSHCSVTASFSYSIPHPFASSMYLFLSGQNLLSPVLLSGNEDEVLMLNK